MSVQVERTVALRAAMRHVVEALLVATTCAREHHRDMEVAMRACHDVPRRAKKGWRL